MPPRIKRKTKLENYLTQLGVVSDAELAALAGVTTENVRAYRTRRGIPARWRGEGEPLPGEPLPGEPLPGEPPPASTEGSPTETSAGRKPKAKPRGGKTSRRATKTSGGKATVRKSTRGGKRAAVAQPPEAAGESTAEPDGAALPTAEPVLSTTAEAPAAAVVPVAEEPAEPAGAPVAPVEPAAPRAVRAVRGRRTRLQDYLDQLGILPDSQVAALAGVTAENVRTYRKRRGIAARWRGSDAPAPRTSVPAAPANTPALRVVATPHPVAHTMRAGKLGRFREQIGILPDARIATLAGTSPANVRAFRLRHNIPARWRGEGQPLPNEEAIILLDAGPAPAAPAVVAAPAPLPEGQDLDGYEITVSPGGTWVVVARDIAEAARRALDALAARGIEGRVVGLRYVARVLQG